MEEMINSNSHQKMPVEGEGTLEAWAEQTLKRWQAPTPTEQQHTKLLEVLMAEMPSKRESQWAGEETRRRARGGYRWAWLLLRGQMRVVQREIWLASLLMMLLGIVVTLSTYGYAQFSTPETVPFVLLMPVIAAMGVALLYGPMGSPALEMELATPVSRRVILLAQLTLLFTFDLALGIASSIVLTLLEPSLSLWLLVIAWLAPMSFLSALAFLLSTLWLDPTISILISLTLWGSQYLMRIKNWHDLYWYLPNLTSTNAQPWLFAMALLLATFALWIADREERWAL